MRKLREARAGFIPSMKAKTGPTVAHAARQTVWPSPITMLSAYGWHHKPKVLLLLDGTYTAPQHISLN
jgi:hypothetical protein